MKKLCFALPGILAAAFVLSTATALAGSGVGAVFNLGEANTVDSSSVLAGTPSTGTAMLDVRNDSGLTGSFGVLGRVTDPGSTSGSAGVRGVGFGAAPGVWGSQNGGAGVYGNAVGGYGVRGTSSSGIGVFGSHTATTGASPGVRGETSSTASAAAGVFGLVTSNSPGTYSAGVRGENPGTGSNGVGVWGSQSGAGKGVYGISGSTGTGVWGQGGLYGVIGTGSSVGVDGYSPSGEGVKGRGGNNGVIGFSTPGNGVSGNSSSGSGVVGNSVSGVGVYGYSLSGSAGYFEGPVTVTGTLTKPAGSFKIDHPLDPAHKYLQHSFVESPDMIDVYNGIVRTDRRGFATVRMPRWFQALNRTFRYQLTIVGSRGWNARVVKLIAHNRFTIQSDAPRVRASWQVTGIRHDRYASANRIQVVVPKAKADQGKYLHPELYGKPRRDTIGLEHPRKEK